MSDFETDDRATVLVDAAHRAAVAKLDGLKPTRENLDKLGELIRRNILVQAALGFWKPLGVISPAELQALVVDVQLLSGSLLAADPPIRIAYDFSRTKLSTLLVEHK